MIRTTLQFLIQRSIDDRRPLHRWLRAVIGRSESLARYEQQAGEMDDLLRRSATVRRQELALQAPTCDAPTVVQVPPSRVIRRRSFGPRPMILHFGWFAGGAVALLLVGLYLQHNIEQQTRAAHAEFLSQQLTAAPDEVLQMLHRAVLASQDELARRAPVASWSLPEFAPWEQVATQVQTPIERSANLMVNELTSFTELLGRWSIEEPTAEIDGGGI